MSVSTPILTTSSEIWAFAALPDANARVAATAAASDFMVSSPRLFVEGFGSDPSSIRLGSRLPSERRGGTGTEGRQNGRGRSLEPRQRGDRDIDRALDFRDHPQRPGIEGDVGKPDI